MTPSPHLYCTTTLNYGNSGNRGGGDGDARTVQVAIENARETSDLLAFDRCGFELIEHRSAVCDWCDSMHVADVHMGEIKDLAYEYSGCDHALVYPPLVRSPKSARAIADYARSGSSIMGR